MSDNQNQPPPGPEGWSQAGSDQGSYGAPNMGPGGPGYGAPPVHYPEKSQSQTVLIVGLVSIVFCQLLGPVAWYMGNEEVKAIDEGRRSPEQRQLADIGRIIGMVMTGLLILGFLLLAFLVVIAVFGAAASA